MSVAFAEIAPRLKTLDQVREKIAATEPLTPYTIASDTPATFRVTDEFHDGLNSTLGTEALPGAFVTVAGKEHQLSKDALLLAASRVGLPQAYVKKAPARFVEEQLGYWYGQDGIANDAHTLLVLNGTAATFIKPTLRPFSNVRLLENVIEKLAERHEGEIYADYKFQHTIQRTDIRLILPDHTRAIEGTDVSDDVWSAGLHISNSLSAASKTTIESYLFRWWCTNGATENAREVGSWSRKYQGQEDDVYAWAADAVNEIFEGMDTRFEEVQALARIRLGDRPGEALTDIFREYGVPVSQRPAVIDHMERVENKSLYEVMQAITQQANSPDVTPDRADALMRIGGTLPHHIFSNQKAKIFKEGQENPDAPNPYEVVVTS